MSHDYEMHGNVNFKKMALFEIKLTINRVATVSTASRCCLKSSINDEQIDSIHSLQNSAITFASIDSAVLICSEKQSEI